MIALYAACRAGDGSRRARPHASTASSVTIGGAQELEQTVPDGSESIKGRIRDQRPRKPIYEKTPNQNSKENQSINICGFLESRQRRCVEFLTLFRVDMCQSRTDSPPAKAAPAPKAGVEVRAGLGHA